MYCLQYSDAARSAIENFAVTRVKKRTCYYSFLGTAVGSYVISYDWRITSFLVEVTRRFWWVCRNPKREAEGFSRTKTIEKPFFTRRTL